MRLEIALAAVSAGDRAAAAQRLQAYASELGAQSSHPATKSFASAIALDVARLQQSLK